MLDDMTCNVRERERERERETERERQTDREEHLEVRQTNMRCEIHLH